MRANSKFLRAVSCAVAGAVLAGMLLTGCSGGGSSAPSSSGAEKPNNPSTTPTEPEKPSENPSEPPKENPADSSSSQPEKEKSVWTYRVISESNKEAVLTGLDMDNPNRPKGAVTIPETVDGYTIVEIGSSAFQKNQEITSVVIPKTVKWIASSAFLACKELTQVVMEEGGVERIDYRAFAGCEKLETVRFSSTLNYIESFAFNGCFALDHVVIPENSEGRETTLVHCSFQGCTSLVHVYLPCSVKKLECPFSFPAADKVIYYQGSEEEWNALGIQDEMDIVGDSRKTIEVHYHAQPQDAMA